MADYLPPVVAKLTGDDSGLTRVLTESKDKVRRWAVDVGKTKVTLQVEAKLKDGTLAEIRRKISDGPAAKLKVELDLAAGQSEEIRRRLADREVQLKVKPVMDQVALRRVQTILMELGKRIDVSVRPVMHDPSQRRAEARLTRLSRDRTATIRTRVIGGGTAGGDTGSAVNMMGTLISLAPALAPIAAEAATVAASIGAATVAVGAFGLAAYPQIKQLGALSDALDTLSAAQSSNAALSKKAAANQQKALAALDGVPESTKRAAAAYGDLRTEFKSWSDTTAKFTMEPVTKSFAVAEAILPKLTPMVKGTSTELDRLMTVAGGAVSTPGFDAMMKHFTDFASGALKHGVDDVIHFSRVLSEGDAKGPVADFMKYAKEQGPAVRETLANIAKAVSQVLQGASQAGPGILSLVNAAAKLVASLPPAFIARAMQLYTALKLIGLTKAGFTGVSGAATGLATRLTALRAASTAAGGGLAGVRAALATLSTGTKVAGVIGVVAGIVLVLNELGSSGKKAPDVDRMTTAIGQLGRTSKMSGELLSTFGKDMSGFAYAVDRVAGKSSGMDKFNDTMNKIFTLGLKKSNSANDAKKQIDAIDQGLANLVQGGKAELAAASLARLTAEYKKSGKPTSNLTDELKKYKSALADAKFEADLTADSQGLFGRQAQQVQKQLDAQKQAAQGLRQAILDLNDANRAGMDAESDYQQAIDDATAGIKKHQHSLTMSNGALNLQSQGARDSYGLLSKLAAAAEASSTATLEQTGSQTKANRVLIDAHAHLVDVGRRMGLTTQDAIKFADSLDNIHDPKIQVTANIDSAQAAANTIQSRITKLSKMKATPKVRADLGRSEAELANLKQQIAGLKSKSVFVTLKVGTTGMPADVKNLYGFGAATGAMITGRTRKMASGGFGRPAMMAKGGSNILWGEGGDESYIPHNRQPRSRAIAEKTVAIMGGSVAWGGTAGGSPAAAAAPLGAQVAHGLWAGMSGQAGWLAAKSKAFALQTIPVPMADALGIKSPSRVAAALGRWVGHGMVQGLTGSTASVKAAALRLSRSIEQIFHDDAARQLAADKKSLGKLAGVKGKSAAGRRADLRSDMRQQQHLLGADSFISRYVAADNARLLKLAAQRDTVSTKLKAAQSKLTALQKSWTDERSSVAGSIMQGASAITASPDQGRSVNANDVLAQMRTQVQAATAFAANLRQLQKAGLRSDLLQQLATAGVDQAGATALALAGSSKGQIQAVNKLQATLSTAANGAGSAVADSMYAAGIRSAQGLVKGLKSQEKAIDAQMLRIAHSMQAAIKKALKIHSPSGVMAELGDHTAMGMALGINRSSKHAVIAARGMAMSVQQGATITGGHSGGGTVVVHNHYTTNVAGSVVSERQLVEVVRAGVLKGGLRNNNVGLTPKR